MLPYLAKFPHILSKLRAANAIECVSIDVDVVLYEYALTHKFLEDDFGERRVDREFAPVKSRKFLSGKMGEIYRESGRIRSSRAQSIQSIAVFSNSVTALGLSGFSATTPSFRDFRGKIGEGAKSAEVIPARLCPARESRPITMAQIAGVATATPAVSWHIILNEHAGPQGSSPTLCDQLTARLRSANPSSFHIHETKYPNHATEIGQRLLIQSGSDMTIAVIGGDGTLHELINGIMAGDSSSGTSRRINIVLLPSGTANALYHSLFPSTCSSPDFDKLLSVEHALSSTSSTCRPLALLSVIESSSAAQKHLYYSHVVTSTCLHAQLLETASSEEWRKLYPGTERFRKAAEKHSGTSYKAHLRLAARDNQGVQKWSTKDASWQTVSKGDLELKGGFTYFVASLVDRFEATFKITPRSAPVASSPRRAERRIRALEEAYQAGLNVVAMPSCR